MNNPFNRLKQCRRGMMLYNVNDLYVGRSLDLYGQYCEQEAQLLENLVGPGDVMLDIGANIGAHTVVFASAVGPQGSVLAFEPQRLAFQTLCANVALNSFVNVWCHNMALGDVDGASHVPVLNPYNPNNFGGVDLIDREGEPVRIARVDRLGLDRCRLMKIDVEGMELAVLRGAAETINRLGPILYVENDRPQSSSALVGFIRSAGYELFWHTPPLFDSDNFLGNPHNVFGPVVSMNMLCVRLGTVTIPPGLRRVE